MMFTIGLGLEIKFAFNPLITVSSQLHNLVLVNNQIFFTLEFLVVHMFQWLLLKELSMSPQR